MFFSVCFVANAIYFLIADNAEYVFRSFSAKDWKKMPKLGYFHELEPICSNCDFWTGVVCRKHIFSESRPCPYYSHSERFDYFFFVYHGDRSIFSFKSLNDCLSNCQYLPGAVIYGVNMWGEFKVGRI